MEQEGGHNLQAPVDPELYRSLGRMEGKLDALMMALEQHIKQDEKAWAKVSALENKLIYVTGAAGAIVFLLTTTVGSWLRKIGVL